MSNRDELAKLLFVTDNDAAPDPYHEWEMAIRHNPRYAEYAFTMADALIRAGYSRPRTVSTVEELDALPVFTVIRIPGLGHVLEKLSDGWHEAAVEATFHPNRHWVPASVLYEPEGK